MTPKETRVTGRSCGSCVAETPHALGSCSGGYRQLQSVGGRSTVALVWFCPVSSALGRPVVVVVWFSFALTRTGILQQR